MCDYSIIASKTRPAKVGDKLTTTRFSMSVGFSSDGTPVEAVCLLPGTELAFDEPVSVKGYFGRFVQTQHRVAIFRQVNGEQLRTHHDCLEFENGTTVFLNDLCERQTASVLQLPAKPRTEVEAKAQRRAEFVG